MNHPLFSLLSLSSVFALTSCAPAAPAAPETPVPAASRPARGDRRPAINEQYPARAFRHNNANAKIIDVTQIEKLGAPRGTNATPNQDSDDDARAFIWALDLIRDRVKIALDSSRNAKGDPNGMPWETSDTSFIIYVPDGTYHVDQTIQYSGPVVHWFGQMRLVGQSRERTVIRLRDNAPGFGAGQQQPLISFSQKATFNNGVANNELRNLTVDVGSGNAGAVGVDFFGANSGTEISNVQIRSGDGAGAIGLHARIGINSGYWHDITVVGFDVGISVDPYHFADPTLEYITLREQNEVGFYVGDATPVVRDVVSINRVPALRIGGAGAHVVLLDASLRNGDANTAAIELNDGQLFARDIVTNGYKAALTQDKTIAVSAPRLEEYNSLQGVSFDGGANTRSMRLPVKESPMAFDAPLAQWKCPEDFGAKGDGTTDDSRAVQAAFDSGASVIYFPAQSYYITATINVPATVRRIAGMQATLNGTLDNARFRVKEASEFPLVAQDLLKIKSKASFAQAGARTLVLEGVKSLGMRLYINEGASNGVELFVNNVGGLGGKPGQWKNQKVWGRFINTENKNQPNFQVGPGAEVWMLGFKTEGQATGWLIEGGTLEVLGGIANQYTQSGNVPFNPSIIIKNGRVSLIFASNGPSTDQGYQQVISDTQNGETKIINWDELPPREGRKHQWIVPLYRN